MGVPFRVAKGKNVGRMISCRVLIGNTQATSADLLGSMVIATVVVLVRVGVTVICAIILRTVLVLNKFPQIWSRPLTKQPLVPASAGCCQGSACLSSTVLGTTFPHGIQSNKLEQESVRMSFTRYPLGGPPHPEIVVE